MKKIIIPFFTLSLVISSCEKSLDQQPQTSLDASIAYTTRQGVEAGLLGCYSSLQSGNYYGLRYWALGDLETDILQHTGTFPSFAQFSNRALLADNTEIANIWSTLYNAINRANNIIAFAPGISDPAFNANQAVAEARFLRGLFYFDLIRGFGGSATGYNKSGGLGVPLFTAPTLSPSDAAPRPRKTEAEIYTQIVSDLDFAIANLPATAVNGRASISVANSIKARLELYRENWAAAETLATTVLAPFAGGGLVPGVSYANIWLLKNQKPESIWELQFDINNTNSIAFFYYPTASGGRNEITSLAAFGAAHEAGDLRLTTNRTITSPTNKTLKYTRVPGDDHVTLVRLSELYLIRAEARARIGTNISGAQADLNVVRTRAGLLITTAATTTDLVNAIERERRIEFAHEGHRKFDMRRYQTFNSLPGVGAETYKNLWPIPQRETLTSNNLITQNPGY